jgi:hypothetical protein
MVQQIGEIGEFYPGETIAKTDILYNRFVARGDNLEDIIYADADNEAVGVAEFDYRQYNPDLSTRIGWLAGETLPVKGNGWAYVEAGEDLVKDQYVMAGTDGVAMIFVDPTIASTPTGANVEAVETIPYTKKGKVILPATAGNLAKIQLYNCL